MDKPTATSFFSHLQKGMCRGGPHHRTISLMFFSVPRVLAQIRLSRLPLWFWKPPTNKHLKRFQSNASWFMACVYEIKLKGNLPGSFYLRYTSLLPPCLITVHSTKIRFRTRLQRHNLINNDKLHWPFRLLYSHHFSGSSGARTMPVMNGELQRFSPDWMICGHVAALGTLPMGSCEWKCFGGRIHPTCSKGYLPHPFFQFVFQKLHLGKESMNSGQ